MRERDYVPAAALSSAFLVISFAAFGQPTCGAPTPRDMEGPFYKAGAPLRASLDFWHADEKGDYDNAGYRYCGRVAADGEGRYRLETILPALYPGRPRHIHVKVQAAPGGRLLTTQLYFRDEQRGPLSLATERREGALHAAFDFVLQ